MESIKDLQERATFRDKHILNEHEIFIPTIGDNGWHGTARLIQDERYYFIEIKKNKRKMTVMKMSKSVFSIREAKFIMHSFLVKHNLEDYENHINPRLRREFYNETI